MENSILYSEINLLCILVLLLVSVKMRKSMFLQEHRRLFLHVTVTNILFLLLDCVWIFVNNNMIGISVMLNWVLNACYYVLSGVLGLCWFTYSETVQDSALVREKRYRPLVLLPMAVLAALTLVSLKTGWLFYIDAQNGYHRGPAYALQLITAYGYVVFTAAKAFALSCKTQDYHRRTELKTLACFVLPTLAAGALQVLFPGLPLLCIGNTVGILYVYLTLQEQLVSRDALTKLNNRNQLFQYLSTKLAHLHEEKDLYLLILDVDYFKSINDQYGHVEGDHALRAVANCLMQCCNGKNHFIARYGGDEFVVICEQDEEKAVQELCAEIHARLAAVGKPYSLTVSIGCARYTPGVKNQQEFIELADRELYKVKKAARQAEIKIVFPKARSPESAPAQSVPPKACAGAFARHRPSACSRHDTP